MLWRRFAGEVDDRLGVDDEAVLVEGSSQHLQQAVLKWFCRVVWLQSLDGFVCEVIVRGSVGHCKSPGWRQVQVSLAGTVTFSIRRPDGTERGRVALRDDDLGDVRWTISATEPNTLTVIPARGYPVLTLTQTRALTGPQSKPADIHGA